MKTHRFRKVHWRAVDNALKEKASDKSTSACELSTALFDYFLMGFFSSKTTFGSGAKLRGPPSSNGRGIDQMEGFTRLAPLFSVWLASGRPEEHCDFAGHRHSLPEILKTGILNGTDESSPGFWGDCLDYDQRVCEAADVALALWLSKGFVWDRMTEDEKAQVKKWLENASRRQVIKNNWLLFPLLISVVLNKLCGFKISDAVHQGYQELKSFYVGQGWFRDGLEGHIDYYNAWGIHYTLFWIDQIAPDLDREFIRGTLIEFSKTFCYFIGPQGFPVFGRSVNYRVAIAAPLIAASRLEPTSMPPGQARRAFEATWRYFIGRGALKGGNVTAGYFADDWRLINNYSGPASGLWSARSLILALYNEETHRFWTDPLVPLPVERSDYCIEIEAADWKVHGVKDTAEITIERIRGPIADDLEIAGHGSLKAAIARVTGRPNRPKNLPARYCAKQYSSKTPFFVKRETR